MIDDKTSIDILVEIFVHNKKKTDIAKQYGISRNTIANICKRYKHLKDRFLKYANNYTQLSELFSVERTKNQNKNIRKIKPADVVAIKECCLQNFNCHLEPIELCKRLCALKGIDFEIVKNYNSDLIETNPFEDDRKNLLREIRKIRSLKKPPKNHRQVYSEYQITDQYKSNKISYEAFYMYAREYWKDITWDKTLGEIIDDQKKIQSKNYTDNTPC